MVLAAIAPLAAALVVPIPGKHESPQRNSPSMGVFKFGKGNGNTLPNMPDWGADDPAAHAIPYVPRSRRKNASCASGEPIILNSNRPRTSGIHRSTALNSTSARSFLYDSYSSDPGVSFSHGSYGSPPEEYTCITCFPSGQSVLSRMDGMKKEHKF